MCIIIVVVAVEQHTRRVKENKFFTDLDLLLHSHKRPHVLPASTADSTGSLRSLLFSFPFLVFKRRLFRQLPQRRPATAQQLQPLTDFLSGGTARSAGRPLLILLLLLLVGAASATWRRSRNQSGG